MKIVHLPLKGEYFDQIKEGPKTVEYRRRCRYWRVRLQGATHAKFRRGYSNKETMLFKIVKTEEMRTAFRIQLGERVDEQ